MNNLEKPITLEATRNKRETNKGKRKVSETELLTKQEKRLLKQKIGQEVLERVEKKKKLKKSIEKKQDILESDNEEVSRGENSSTIFTAPENLPFETETQPVNIDDLSFKDIVNNQRKEKTSGEDTLIEEKKLLLDMFGTDVPSEIDAILKQGEASGALTVTSEPETNPWDNLEDSARNQAREDKFERYMKGRAQTEQLQLAYHPKLKDVKEVAGNNFFHSLKEKFLSKKRQIFDRNKIKEYMNTQNESLSQSDENQ
jgi:hypothetical protein